MRPQVELGSFVVGEIPLPLQYVFATEDGGVIDLTSYTTATFQWGEYVRGLVINPVTETAVITGPVSGEVTYTWDGDEFATTGQHAGMFFVNNGTQSYASIVITWQVCAAIGVPPAV